MSDVTSKDARIQTLSVAIRTLTVGNKQMTISVFKQLPSLPSTVHDGIVWGWVNHYLKDRRADTHLIVQVGDTLYRDSFTYYDGNGVQLSADVAKAKAAYPQLFIAC